MSRKIPFRNRVKPNFRRPYILTSTRLIACVTQRRVISWYSCFMDHVHYNSTNFGQICQISFLRRIFQKECFQKPFHCWLWYFPSPFVFSWQYAFDLKDQYEINPKMKFSCFQVAFKCKLRRILQNNRTKNKQKIDEDSSMRTRTLFWAAFVKRKFFSVTNFELMDRRTLNFRPRTLSTALRAMVGTGTLVSIGQVINLKPDTFPAGRADRTGQNEIDSALGWQLTSWALPETC